MSEIIYIKFQNKISLHGFYPIFKNNNYIFKISLNYKELAYIGPIESLGLIYCLIKFYGTKFYEKEKIFLLKYFCDNCGIEYEITSKEMEIFVITKLNFVEKQKSKHKINIFRFEDYKIFTRIGKFVLFI